MCLVVNSINGHIYHFIERDITKLSILNQKIANRFFCQTLHFAIPEKRNLGISILQIFIRDSSTGELVCRQWHVIYNSE